MYKYEITKRIEEFAPPITQEQWDCSGWVVSLTGNDDIKKVMLCLTVTEDIVNQALNAGCNMIVSHHPMFYIPFNRSTFEPFNQINIYCAHTNLDKAIGGTTDTIIKNLGLEKYIKKINHEYLRMIEYPVSTKDFGNILKRISSQIRVVNNLNKKELYNIAFCAGSGSEFISDAKEFGADCLVTGDIKFHAALDSPIVLYDIGHFDSEIMVLPVFKELIGEEVEVIYAKEESPFKNI